MSLGFSKTNKSFSRDLLVLAVAVAFLLFLLATWISYRAYTDHYAELQNRLYQDAIRLDRTLTQDVNQASYLLEAISKQVIQQQDASPTDIARILRAYDTQDTVFNMFAWVDERQRVVATSAKGVLSTITDVSDRDYVKKSISQSWKVHIGRPVESRASSAWIIPLGMGVQDYKGKYLGTVVTSLNIDKLTRQMREVLGDDQISLTLLTKTLLEVTESSEDAEFIDESLSLNKLQRIDYQQFPHGALSEIEGGAQPLLAYYLASEETPFLFVLGRNLQNEWRSLLWLMGQRLIPLFLIAAFSAGALLAIRRRVIDPLAQLGKESERILRGESQVTPVKGPAEVTFLSRQLQQICAYIQERRRIEFEQKAKLATLKRAKDNAELSNRVKVDFLNAMSHEFRTPLNTISGFTELMQNQVYGSLGNSRYNEYVADITDSVNAMQSLVSDVIALTKAETAQYDVQEKAVEVQLVVARSIRTLADKLREAGVTVENRVVETLPKLRVDEARLRQIIQNLIFNALSHTPQGGMIIVDARVAEDKLHQPVYELIVSDSGRKPALREDKLKEEDTTEKPFKIYLRKPGNLGIPLTKALVAMQQASLEVDSPPGKPTVVIVRYPKEKIVL
jgi:signal transduction histidine kinase